MRATGTCVQGYLIVGVQVDTFQDAANGQKFYERVFGRGKKSGKRTRFRHRLASFGPLSRWRAIPAPRGFTMTYKDRIIIGLTEHPNGMWTTSAIQIVPTG